MSGDKMYAAVLHHLGEPPRYERFPWPAAGADEELITVAASSLKPSDRLMADGVGYAPSVLPHVAGLDGVGRTADGRRVAFSLPRAPHGGMAERTVVRRGAWLPVPPELDDVTAAALANPGMAAWKTVVWEGELAAGQTVLVLGATGTSGRLATQLGLVRRARVVAAGRNPRILAQLRDLGADVIDLDQPNAALTAAFAAAAPYDLIADYLWGPPTEALFAALGRGARQSAITRHIVVGMAAGGDARLPAMTLRRAPLQIIGSGSGRSLTFDQAAEGFAELGRLVADGAIDLPVSVRPLAEVEAAWNEPDSTRTVLVPN